MTKVYEFNTDLSFEGIVEKFEHFHDWVIQDVNIQALKEDIEQDSAFRVQYDIVVVLRDKYKRFEKDCVALEFENVGSVSMGGLRERSGEVMGVTVERTPSGITFSTEDDNLLRIEAEGLTYRLL